MDNLTQPEGVATVILAGAALLRLVMALLKTPILGGALDKVPKELRPLVTLALAAALAFLESLASGGGVVHAIAVAGGVFTVTEGSYRVQRGRQKRIGNGSIRLRG